MYPRARIFNVQKFLEIEETLSLLRSILKKFLNSDPMIIGITKSMKHCLWCTDLGHKSYKVCTYALSPSPEG